MFKKSNNDKQVQEAQASSPRFGGSNQTQQEAIMHTGLVGKSQHEYLKLADRHPNSRVNNVITPEELEKHVSVNDAWLSLDGEVYDVTQYLRYHPGGKKIMEGCGRECRELFNKYHSWVNGKYLLQKFKVGNLGYDPSKPKFGASLK